MKYLEFIKKHNLTGGNNQYQLREVDWNNFIEKYEGVHCGKMCKKEKKENVPYYHTEELFGNDAASDIFCNWCQK